MALLVSRTLFGEKSRRIARVVSTRWHSSASPLGSVRSTKVDGGYVSIACQLDRLACQLIDWQDRRDAATGTRSISLFTFEQIIIFVISGAHRRSCKRLVWDLMGGRRCEEIHCSNGNLFGSRTSAMSSSTSSIPAAHQRHTKTATSWMGDGCKNTNLAEYSLTDIKKWMSYYWNIITGSFTHFNSTWCSTFELLYIPWEYFICSTTVSYFLNG